MNPTVEILDEDTETPQMERPVAAPLTMADRCDSCGAQAFVWAIMPDSENGLLYCGHHFNEYEAGLRAVAIDIIDERHRINTRASQSSPD